MGGYGQLSVYSLPLPKRCSCDPPLLSSQASPAQMGPPAASKVCAGESEMRVGLWFLACVLFGAVMGSLKIDASHWQWWGLFGLLILTGISAPFYRRVDLEDRHEWDRMPRSWKAPEGQ